MAERKQRSSDVQRKLDRELDTFGKLETQKFDIMDRIRECNVRIADLRRLLDATHDEEIRDTIDKAWLGKKRMSDAQILKYIEISKQLDGKIDILGAEEVVQAVNDVYVKKLEENTGNAGEMEVSEVAETIVDELQKTPEVPKGYNFIPTVNVQESTENSAESGGAFVSAEGDD